MAVAVDGSNRVLDSLARRPKHVSCSKGPLSFFQIDMELSRACLEESPQARF